MTLKYRYKEPTKTSGEKPPVLLLLHGFGADENDLFGLAPYMDERFFVASVQAPFALPFGGRAWFELYFEMGQVSGFDPKQFEESWGLILETVDEIIAEHDLDSTRVYICGFSQGSMISISSVFKEPEKFAGAVLMSGRAANEMIVQENIEKLKDFPILVTHGTFDTVLPVENGRATKEILSHLPVDLEYKEYPMAHEISQESLQDVSNWLRLALDK
jgi:phospholipase/carboxylesterase